MTAEDGLHCLEHSLSRDPSGRFSFVCKKTFVLVKLYGDSRRMRFSARDKVAFRPEGDALVVEKPGAVVKRFLWNQIECLCAGEPEKDDGSLFQG